MKISFYNIYEILNKDNFLFENDNVSIGDNLMSPFLRMNEYAKNNNIELGTIDKIPIFDSDVIVFVDCPNKNKIITYELMLYLCDILLPLVFYLNPLKITTSHLILYGLITFFNAGASGGC